MNESKLNKKSKHFNLIRWFKEDKGFVLTCVGIAAFFIFIYVFGYFEDKKVEARRVSVDAYSLEEINQIFSTADEIQYTCYSDYWDQPFTIIADGKGIEL